MVLLFCRLQMQAEGNEHILRECVTLLKDITGVEVPQGHNPELQFRSHLWDGLPGLHMPLMFYALTEALGEILAGKGVLLLLCGPHVNTWATLAMASQ